MKQIKGANRQSNLQKTHRLCYFYQMYTKLVLTRCYPMGYQPMNYDNNDWNNNIHQPQQFPLSPINKDKNHNSSKDQKSYSDKIYKISIVPCFYILHTICWIAHYSAPPKYTYVIKKATS
jgi:hypothetical protein